MARPLKANKHAHFKTSGPFNQANSTSLYFYPSTFAYAKPLWWQIPSKQIDSALTMTKIEI